MQHLSNSGPSDEPHFPRVLPSWIREQLHAAKQAAAPFEASGVAALHVYIEWNDSRGLFDRLMFHIAREFESDRVHALSMEMWTPGCTVKVRLEPTQGPDSELMLWSERDTVMRAAGFDEPSFSPTCELDGCWFDCEFSSYFKDGPF